METGKARERWREIPGFEGHYEASTSGRVRSIARMKLRLHAVTGLPYHRRYGGRVLKPKTDKETGRRYVNLTMENKPYFRQVARLVAAAWLDADPARCTVNHKDGDTANDRASNLEWATQGENQKHKWRVLGCRHYRTGQRTRHYGQPYKG